METGQFKTNSNYLYWQPFAYKHMHRNHSSHFTMTTTLKKLILQHKFAEASQHATRGPLITNLKELDAELPGSYVRGHIVHVTTYEAHATFRYGAKRPRVTKPYDRLVLFRSPDLGHLVWIKTKSTIATRNLFLANADNWFNTVVLVVAPVVAAKELFGLLELETLEPLIPASDIILEPVIEAFSAEDAKPGVFTGFYGQLTTTEFSMRRISLPRSCTSNLCPGPHEGKCAGTMSALRRPRLGLACRFRSEAVLPQKQTLLPAVDISLDLLSSFFVEEHFLKEADADYNPEDLEANVVRILADYSAAGIKFEVVGWAKSSLAADEGAFEAEATTFHVSCLRPLTILPNVRLFPTAIPPAIPAAEEDVRPANAALAPDGTDGRDAVPAHDAAIIPGSANDA